MLEPVVFHGTSVSLSKQGLILPTLRRDEAGGFEDPVVFATPNFGYALAYAVSPKGVPLRVVEINSGNVQSDKTSPRFALVLAMPSQTYWKEVGRRVLGCVYAIPARTFKFRPVADEGGEHVSKETIRIRECRFTVVTPETAWREGLEMLHLVPGLAQTFFEGISRLAPRDSRVAGRPVHTEETWYRLHNDLGFCVEQTKSNHS